jgi:YD repeat-containing protein
MKRATCLFILIMLLSSLLPLWAAPPSVKVGAYTITVENVARALDLTQLADKQACTVITLSINAPAEAMGRLLETIQQPTCNDDLGSVLLLREVRVIGKTIDSRTAPVKTVLQVWLSPVGNGSTEISDFSASIQSYEKREPVRLDFLSVADELPASQSLEGMTVVPEFVGPKTVANGKVYQIRLDIRSGPDKTAPAPLLSNEQIELIDAEGQPKSALSTQRSYKYDDEGKVTGRTITATFALPAQAPRGVRYRADRLRGVESWPYHFENLPLP